MTAQISVHGRLVADPQEKVTQSGKAMTIGRIAVTLPMKDGEHTLWLSLMAFGQQAALLARHRKGDVVSASGNMVANVWKDGEGNERESFQIMTDALISARTVRPKGGSGSQQGKTDHTPQRAREQAKGNAPHDDTGQFDDGAPF